MEVFENPQIPFKSIEIEKTKSHISNDMAGSQVHIFYELYFLLSGERRYTIGHKIYNVAPGNLIIVPKNSVHKTSGLSRKGYDRYVIYFSDKSVENLIEQIGTDEFDRFLSFGCLSFPPQYEKKLRSDLDRLFVEEKRDDALSYSIKKNILYSLILTALREGTPKSCAVGEGADKIQFVAKYISEHFSSKITLEEAAEMANMEKTYFSKRFKALTGLGFCTYLLQTRISAAKTKLVATDMSVLEISDACGFSGSNYFGDVFKKTTGLSPLEYRKQNKIPEN